MSSWDGTSEATMAVLLPRDTGFRSLVAADLAGGCAFAHLDCSAAIGTMLCATSISCRIVSTAVAGCLASELDVSPESMHAPARFRIAYRMPNTSERAGNAFSSIEASISVAAMVRRFLRDAPRRIL